MIRIATTQNAPLCKKGTTKCTITSTIFKSVCNKAKTPNELTRKKSFKKITQQQGK